jgi:hypothetical protein
MFLDELDWLVNEEEAIANIFITGVTPLIEFEHFTDISFDSDFHDMMGFATQELRLAVDALTPKSIGARQTMSDIVALYRGYRFSLFDPEEDWHEDEEDQEEELEMEPCPEEFKCHVFNPSMVFRYLMALMETGAPPKLKLGPKFRSYPKIKEIAMIKMKKRFNLKKLLSSIAEGELLEVEINQSFGFNEFSESDFLSFMFYMGYLTILSTDEEELSTLMIPNGALKRIYSNPRRLGKKISVKQRPRGKRP